MSKDLEAVESSMPDDLEPLRRLRMQVDVAIQLAESGQIKKLSNEDLALRHKHPEIIAEIGDFEIRWRGKSKDYQAETNEWIAEILSALHWIDQKNPAVARQILMKTLKKK